MKKAVLCIMLFAAVLFPVLSKNTAAQESAQEKQKTPSTMILENWNDVGNKLIAMAEDWPEDKYDYRPNDKVRTFAEQLLHVAAANYFATNRALGIKDKVNENPPRSTYKTKEQVVAYVKKSVADGAAAIQKVGDAGVIKDLDYWAGLTEHMGEHYGQLVVYYRNNGVVPPDSRPKK
jgi:DinB superfamily